MNGSHITISLLNFEYEEEVANVAASGGKVLQSIGTVDHSNVHNLLLQMNPLWYFCETEFRDAKSPVKCGVVFPVYRNRDKEEALKEAWDFERQLESTSGYGIWLRSGRESLEFPPSSTSLKDIQGFSAWFGERKKYDDVDGVFIMVM